MFTPGIQSMGSKIQAIKAVSKIYCKQHHLFTNQTTYIDKNGHRNCKTCNNIRHQNARKKRLNNVDSPLVCKHCSITGNHNFYHDITDGMESFRCRQCGTEHYAYDAPPKSSKPGGKYSS